MGRRSARALHLALSTFGAVLYALFVIPRWWVLTGDIPATLATVGRIATGLPIAAAAVPVALSLKSALQPEAGIPVLAQRLRAWSTVLHVVAGALISVTAVAEIWLSNAGPWLFGSYGAAGSVAVLAVLAFSLSFTAEKPPKPAKVKPAKTKPAKASKQRRGRKGATVDATADAPAGVEQTDAEQSDAVQSDEPAPESGALRNTRPSGKARRKP